VILALLEGSEPYLEPWIWRVGLPMHQYGQKGHFPNR